MDSPPSPPEKDDHSPRRRSRKRARTSVFHVEKSDFRSMVQSFTGPSLLSPTRTPISTGETHPLPDQKHFAVASRSTNTGATSTSTITMDDDVLMEVESPLPEGEEPEDLPEELKRLSVYFSLFPSDYEFRRDELVQMWIAEGFIEESQKVTTEEDVGCAYFSYLEQICFLVPSRCDFSVEFDSVCSVTSYNPGNLLFKVNPVKLSELRKTTAPVDYFAAVADSLDGDLELTQHLSLNCKDIDQMAFGILNNFKHLRTLLLLSGHESSIKHVPRDLFLSLKDLRTLNLSRTLISEVPSSIRNVKSLRYLDLSNTRITQLPESIDSLQHLQTIKLRGCVHFLQLPKGMKKLINLRHMDLDIIRQLRAMPPHLGNLANLQSMSAFLVGREEGCRIGELKNLNNLKGVLRLSRLENVLDKEEAQEASLIQKQFLQRLELRWSNVSMEKIEEQEKILECLQPHAGLQELQIQQYAGSTLPTWINHPSLAALVVLTLYRCTNCQLLPCIGQLQMLRSLSIIEMNEVKEINHQFHTDGLADQAFHAFPKLEILEVDIMLNMKEWKEVKLGDFPSLLKLTIDSCPELDCLPSLSSLKALKHLEFKRCPKVLSLPFDGLPTSLESFIVIDCPELKEWCRKLEGEDWSKIYHVPSIWFDCEEEIHMKRPRLVWTPQLHKRFVDAVAHLGIKNAVPKTIMQLMSVDGLTTENVASHLQKYRLYLKRMQGLSAGTAGGAGGGGSADPATDHLFASSPVPAHFLHSGRPNSDHFLPFVPLTIQHHHHQQQQQQQHMAAAAATHPQMQQTPQNHHHRQPQVGHFGSPPNPSGQFEHPFLARQSQPGHKIGAPIHSPAVPGYIEDMESVNATGATERKDLTPFPTGED